MNLQQLADLAGVSVSTVSKALTGKKDVGNTTKQRIQLLAKQNGCFSKYSKQKYSHRVLAIICPEISSEYYCAIIGEIENQVRLRGDELVISISHFDDDREATLFQYHTEYQQADGIILIGHGRKIRNYNNSPLVQIGFGNDGPDTVTINSSHAFAEIFEHLKKLGHKKIAFCGENLTPEKQKMFLKAADDFGVYVPAEYVICTNKRFADAGRDAAEKLSRLKTMPTAVIAAYDYIAIGIIKRLQELNICVPEDVSVVGMDDISLSSCLSIPLTTVKIDSVSLAKQVTELLYCKIEHQWYSAKNSVCICANLVTRNSTCVSRAFGGKL